MKEKINIIKSIIYTLLSRYNKVYFIGIGLFLFSFKNTSAQNLAIKFNTNISSSFNINNATYDSLSNCYYMAVSSRQFNGFSTGLIKLDKCGNITWFKQYNNLKGVGSYSCNIITPNIINLTTGYENISTNNKGSNILVDSSGNIISQITTKKTQQGMDIIRKGNGGVNFIIGSNSIYGLDNLGNVIWSKLLKGLNQFALNANIYSTTVKSNGDLLLFLTGSDTSEIVEINNAGNIVNQIRIPNGYSPYYSFTAFPDGIYIQYNRYGQLENYGKSTIRIDNNLNLVWAKEIYSTNGIDTIPPLYGNGFTFPYSMNFNDGIFYADFSSNLTGTFHYNIVGLNVNSGAVVSHNYFDKKVFHTTTNNMVYGLILEDSITSLYKPFILSGKQDIFNNCYIKTDNNASVKNIPLIIIPSNDFALINDTSGLEKYTSFSILENIITSTFLCNKLDIGNDSTVCNFNSYYLTITDSLQFQKVIWNTGDSVFKLKITQPGRYIALVFNSCGLSISDTVNIIQTFQTKRDTTFNICKNDTIIYHNKRYNEQGTYFDTIISLSNCDTLQKITITVFPTYNAFIHDTICEGDLFNNKAIYNDTLIINKYITAKVCDSIINNKIKVNKKTSSMQTLQVCKTSMFNGIVITRDTTIKKVVLNKYKCDSTITYTIKVEDTIRVFLDTSICIGDIFQNKFFLKDTSIQLLNKNVTGCDSITFYNIHVNILNEKIVNASICRGLTYILPSGKSTSQTGTYKDTLKKNIGCDSVIITNLILVDPTPIVQNILICEGLTYTLPNGNKVKNTGIYTDTIKQANTCDSIIITNLSTFLNTFTIQLKPNDTIDIGDSITLNPFYAGDTAINWIWTPTVNLSCSNCTNPIANPTQNIQYIIKASTQNGCEDTASIHIIIRNTDVYIPNAFSPNNDGVNDELNVFVSNSVLFNLKIYNRWGQEIFESNSNQDRWNGIFKGENCPADNYVYILHVILMNGKEFKKQGTITLLR